MIKILQSLLLVAGMLSLLSLRWRAHSEWSWRFGQGGSGYENAETELTTSGGAQISFLAESEKPRFSAFGDVVDELNGGEVYYNGAVSTTRGRYSAADGYNFGLRYQCVEFVKRYSYQKLGHRMPSTWGHAREFYDPDTLHGRINPLRGLVQYQNGASEKRKRDDLIVFGPTKWNSYGHVAIVSQVLSRKVEIAQQNPGPQGEIQSDFASF